MTKEQMEKEFAFLVEAINESQATKVEKAAIRGWLIEFVRRYMPQPQAVETTAYSHGTSQQTVESNG